MISCMQWILLHMQQPAAFLNIHFHPNSTHVRRPYWMSAMNDGPEAISFKQNPAAV